MFNKHACKFFLRFNALPVTHQITGTLLSASLSRIEVMYRKVEWCIELVQMTDCYSDFGNDSTDCVYSSDLISCLPQVALGRCQNIRGLQIALITFSKAFELRCSIWKAETISKFSKFTQLWARKDDELNTLLELLAIPFQVLTGYVINVLYHLLLSEPWCWKAELLAQHPEWDGWWSDANMMSPDERNVVVRSGKETNNSSCQLIVIDLRTDRTIGLLKSALSFQSIHQLLLPNKNNRRIVSN